MLLDIFVYWCYWLFCKPAFSTKFIHWRKWDKASVCNMVLECDCSGRALLSFCKKNINKTIINKKVEYEDRWFLQISWLLIKHLIQRKRPELSFVFLQIALWWCLRETSGVWIHRLNRSRSCHVIVHKDLQLQHIDITVYTTC